MADVVMAHAAMALYSYGVWLCLGSQSVTLCFAIDQLFERHRRLLL